MRNQITNILIVKSGKKGPVTKRGTIEAQIILINLLGIKLLKDKINIKGKTTEKLGIIGKEKAIACEVITSVIKYGLYITCEVVFV